MTVRTYIEAISAALDEEMARDDRVLLLGEDIAAFGGAFKVTKGLLERYGDQRVIDTPIAESGFTGMAGAMAIDGLRPVVEYQFADFMTCAFDAIVQFIAKACYRWGTPVPIVLRAPAGAGVRGGPFHSVSPEAWFAHTPGLKVVYPSTPYDAKGLLKAAIRDDNPVIYLEHKKLYRTIREDIPDDDFIVPLGSAEVKMQGDDLTIVTYGAMVHETAAAIGQLGDEGITCDLVDLRSLVPLDLDTVLASVQRTHRVLIVTEEHKTAGFSAEVSARIAEQAFDSLDAPIGRLGALDVPHPYSGVLEDAILPNSSSIYNAAIKLIEF
jgi:2-oxoisovalerate dehydrogenase E1 component beta subunit